MLVMVVAPVMAQIGELHEVGHTDADSGHFDTHHDEMPSPLTDDGKDREISHVLAHASHCCGSASVVLPMVFALHLPTLLTSAIATARQFVEHRISFLPFRPPITA